MARGGFPRTAWRGFMTRPIVRIILLALSLLASQALRAQDCKSKLDITTVKKNGKVYFYALNTERLFPMHVRLKFPVLENYKYSAPLPGHYLIPPLKKDLLGFLTRENPESNAR
jgi:hypothetical protein